MKSLILVLLCSILAFNLSHCQRFQASAESLFAKVESHAVKGFQAESESYQKALKNYEQAQALLEVIQRRFPSDPLVLQIENNFQPIGPLKNQQHLKDLLQLTQTRATLENDPDAFFRAYGHDLCDGLAFYAKKNDYINFQLLLNKFEWADEELIQNLILEKINEKQLSYLVDMIRTTENDSSRNALEVWGSILLQQNRIDDAKALYESLMLKSKIINTDLFGHAVWQNELLIPDPGLNQSKDRMSLKLMEYYLGKQKDEEAMKILPNIIQTSRQHQAMIIIMQYWEKNDLLNTEKISWLLDHTLLDIDMEQKAKETIQTQASSKISSRFMIITDEQPFITRLHERKERSNQNDSYHFLIFLSEKLGSWHDYRPGIQKLIAKVYPQEGFPNKSHSAMFEPLISSLSYPDYLQVLTELSNETWKRDAIKYLSQNDPGIRTMEQARPLVNLLPNSEHRHETWKNIVINWSRNHSEEQCLMAIQQLPNTALMAQAYLEMLRTWGEIGQKDKANSYLTQALSLIDSVDALPSAYYAPSFESFEEARKAIRLQAYVLLLFLGDPKEAEKIRTAYALEIPFRKILHDARWMLQTEKHPQLWQVSQHFPGLFRDSSAFDAFHADYLLLLTDFQQDEMFEDYLSMLPFDLIQEQDLKGLSKNSPIESKPELVDESDYKRVKQLILKNDPEEAWMILSNIQDIHWKCKALADYYLHFNENPKALTEDFNKTMNLILFVMVR